MNCPFLSVRESFKDLSKPLNSHVCTPSCALYVDGKCAFAVIAIELSKAKKQDANLSNPIK